MMHGVETLVRTEVESMLLHGLPQEELEVWVPKGAGLCGCRGSGGSCILYNTVAHVGYLENGA